MNQEARQWLNSGKKDKKMPPELACFDPAIFEGLDRSGALVYADTITYEHHKMADRIFPYCAKLIGKGWEQVVVDFYKKYPSSHFDFNKICKEFSTYLKEHRPDLMERFPYLAELADYEWLELEKFEDPIEVAPAEDVAITGLEQINSYCPVANQTMTVCHYKYPILDIASYVENAKKPRRKFSEKTCRVAIYRDPQTHQPRFIELGEATAAIVETAQKGGASYLDLLKLTLSLTPELDPAKTTLEFLNLIEELQNDRIFVGSKLQGE